LENSVTRFNVYGVLINYKGEGVCMRIQEVCDEKLLLDTAQWGHKEIVQVLILRGVDVNAKGNFGETALMMAAYWGHKEIAELLIKNGAYVNAKDNNGTTALMMAVSEFESFFMAKNRQDRLEIIEMLLAAGAAVNTIDKEGKTALDYAVEMGYKMVIVRLKQAAAKKGRDIP
jgi:ankyrin repeat protein